MTSLILRIRPALSVALCALILCAVASSARAQAASLKPLYEQHRWFDLRDLVEKHPVPAFYQGAVACAFNDLGRCETEFRGVFKSAPSSCEAIEAHRILASAYFTHGEYNKALAQVDALLALSPADSDALSDRPLFAVLARSPDLKFVGRHTTVELRDGALPFSINRVQATYWFDTGAELSVMTQSEAKRFGLRIHSAPVKVGDVNGTQVNTRIAVVDELSMGSVRLKQVAFLVVPDDQPPFNELSLGSRGLIRLPALLALNRFAFGADRKFEIRAESSSRSAPHADLCFDGQHPVVQIRYDHRGLAFTLDTGASNTDLYPPFAAAFPELIRSAVRTDSYKMEGVGGAKYMQAAILKSLKLSIGGFPVTLKSADVLLKPTTATSKFFDGNLGIEPYQQARKTTFDFQTMTLTLQ
jgi:Aspartyl protease